MHQANMNAIAQISGGVSLFIYPIVGCGMHTAITYYNNPTATYGQLGKGCLKGALHSANPAFGLTGSIAHPLGRFMAGTVYGFGANSSVESMFPTKEKELGCMEICPSDMYTLSDFGIE